ncbi:MAG TPA: AI-2E family transporter [Candidatus Dormibacteraeota bacterium]|nr:AI-2E family transporter [Candidatus Dormibacteraeota bacterium]
MSVDATRWRWIRALLIPLIIGAWLGVIVLLFWLVSHVTTAVLMLVLAAIIAYAIRPVVNLFTRWLPNSLSIAGAYLVAFALILVFLSFIVVTAAEQVARLVVHAPGYIKEAERLEPQVIALLHPLGVNQIRIEDVRNALIAAVQKTGGQVASGTFDVLQAVGGAVVDAILVLILSIYLTANGPAIGAWVRSHASVGSAFRAAPFVSMVNQVVGGYVRGTLAMATLVGALVAVGMYAIQVPYALLLGVIAFFMEFVPVLGVMISGGICIAISLTDPPWWRALIVLAYFVVVHIIEGDFVGPRIMGRAVGIHPAVALVALVAGTELFGIWGALFGAPIAGLIQGLVIAVWQQLRPAPVLVPATAADVEEEREARPEKVP